MAKARNGTKKPSAKPAHASKASAKRAAKPAARPAPKASPKHAAKPAAPKAAVPKPAAPKAPAPKAPAPKAPAPKAAAPKAAPPKAAPPKAATGRAAAPKAANPAPVAPPKPVKRAEAPKPFQREYRKWLERLLALRRQLVEDGERLGEEGLKALEQEVSVDHMADFGSDSYEQDTTLSLIENKSEALRDVDEAIRRIEVKTYGLCEECEQLIPHGRLEVLPHARYCVKCQAAREGVA